MADRRARAIRKLPRAVFGLELQPAGSVRQELADLLKGALSKRFGLVQVRYPFIQRFYRQSMLILSVNGKDVLVRVLRNESRQEQPEYQREWMVLVDRFSGPVWQVLKHDSERGYESEFSAVSDEIHELLIKIPGITRLRWYFKGWDPKKPAVQTPAELPWQSDGSGAKTKPHPAT